MRLEGERVVLRDLAPRDVEPYVQTFLDDPPMLEPLGETEGPSRREVLAMLRRQPKAREAGERLQLTLADPASDGFLGEIVLHHFHWTHRRTEVGFFVASGARRRGVALEAVTLLTRWAFEALELHRVALVTLPENQPALRLAERAGFTREGVLRDYTFELGRFADNVVFSRLAGERAA